MEKINALIEKLMELKNSRSDLHTISYYSQLLQAEVMHHLHLLQEQRPSPQSHVAVIMPNRAVVEDIPTAHTSPVQPSPAPTPATPPVQPVQHVDIPVVQPVAPVATPAPAAAIQPVSPPVQPVQMEVPVVQELPKVKQSIEEKIQASLFEVPHYEPPTHHNGSSNGHQHTQQPEAPKTNGASLNDILRKNTVEVGQRLGDMKVQDLRNAIGINDKFQFIQELFRGDKAMYDRSIKTINEADSYHSANYWIERELVIKLGWQEEDHLVQQFHAIVKKRFS
ncbi:hypothetical protein LX64_04433 [Chitinophaga skermanii]|uniref:Uncharacterized protein n=1 Tax=Chitinophaga skermanii TaxID=331697 RepID=A0A327Q626_9BACT|nr:hypothetical protein [Chitinophaga skermanii]RAI99879.1 hypothetical protein LX64_04433 [Chitinophaga skermanii]